MSIINHIKVEKLKSKYILDEHDCLTIDGVALDVMLYELYPNEELLGLVPVIVEWLSFEEEKRLVRSRYHSSEKMQILPVLMCPDDCDLYCTLIVAEVMLEDEEIIWNRIGIDITNLTNSIEEVGKEVQWLELMPALRFKKTDYYNELNLIYCP